MELRPYDPERDREALWGLKRAFELELGAGDDHDLAAYEGKLTDDYRERYLAWVDRCVGDEPRCVTLAVPGNSGHGEDGSGGAADGGTVQDGSEPVGYAFLLPERLAMVWDAAVLNELYVAPSHRGTGLAGDLVDGVVDLASEQDLPLDRLLLDVDPDNERARAFYEKQGFEPWGEVVAKGL